MDFIERVNPNIASVRKKLNKLGYKVIYDYCPCFEDTEGLYDGKIYFNEKLVWIAVNIYGSKEILHTILHEYRHALQRKFNLPETEIDADNWADEQLELYYSKHI